MNRSRCRAPGPVSGEHLGGGLAGQVQVGAAGAVHAGLQIVIGERPAAGALHAQHRSAREVGVGVQCGGHLCCG